MAARTPRRAHGLALAAAAPVLVTIWSQGSVWTLDHLFWVDLALGPAVACLLARLASGAPSPLVRLLDARPIRTLGRSSYSLYLTHGPIVVIVAEVVRGHVAKGCPFLVTPPSRCHSRSHFARLFASVLEQPSSRRWHGRRAGRTVSATTRTSTNVAVPR